LPIRIIPFCPFGARIRTKTRTKTTRTQIMNILKTETRTKILNILRSETGTDSKIITVLSSDQEEI